MRISDWSSDVCSSDLKRTDIDRSQGALPHLIAFGDRLRVHGLHELDSGIARPELFRRTVLNGSFVRDRRIGDEDFRGLVATAPAPRLVDLAAPSPCDKIEGGKNGGRTLGERRQ